MIPPPPNFFHLRELGLQIPEKSNFLNPEYAFSVLGHIWYRRQAVLSGCRSNFDKDLETVIIVHGYQADHTSDWVETIKEALLDKVWLIVW